MRTTRRTARWVALTGGSLALVVVVALLAAPVVGAGPGWGGGGGDGDGVHGRAMSRGETDSYFLALGARGDGEDARGRLFFGHRSGSGDGEAEPAEEGSGSSEEGFGGQITCLSVADDGVVHVTGTIQEGRRHRHGSYRFGAFHDPGGGNGSQEQAAQEFAFTILTRSDPQEFSLPKVGEAGTLTPCEGGDDTTVPVTRGGFRTRG